MHLTSKKKSTSSEKNQNNNSFNLHSPTNTKGPEFANEDKNHPVTHIILKTNDDVKTFNSHCKVSVTHTPKLTEREKVQTLTSLSQKNAEKVKLKVEPQVK